MSEQNDKRRDEERPGGENGGEEPAGEEAPRTGAPSRPEDPSPPPAPGEEERGSAGEPAALTPEQIEAQIAMLGGGAPAPRAEGEEERIARPIGYVRKHGGLPATRQALGQNWLEDAGEAAAIAAATRAGEGDLVLEVGPGAGALTGPLLQRGPEVIGVEIDRRLVRELQERHGDHPRLQIVHDDVIRADWGSITGGRPFVLAGNLPYNITSALLFKALDVAREQPGLVRRIVVLLQHEVAQRLVAEPGSSEYSVLTVFLRMFGEPELLRVVPRGAFRPPPKVDAGLLRVKLGERIRYPVPHWPTLRALVKGTFAKRRKMLRNTIPSIPGLAPMEGVAFDWTRRPQTLSAEEFAWLAAQLTPKAKRKDGHDG